MSRSFALDDVDHGRFLILGYCCPQILDPFVGAGDCQREVEQLEGMVMGDQSIITVRSDKDITVRLGEDRRASPAGHNNRASGRLRKDHQALNPGASD